MNAQEAPIYVTNNLTGTFQKDPINYHNLEEKFSGIPIIFIIKEKHTEEA